MTNANKSFFYYPTFICWVIYIMGSTKIMVNDFFLVICWVIAFIRAIEALFNIGKRLEEQRSFSIQHLINNVPVNKFGF